MGLGFSEIWRDSRLQRLGVDLFSFVSRLSRTPDPTFCTGVEGIEPLTGPVRLKSFGYIYIYVCVCAKIQGELILAEFGAGALKLLCCSTS